MPYFGISSRILASSHYTGPVSIPPASGWDMAAQPPLSIITAAMAPVTAKRRDCPMFWMMSTCPGKPGLIPSRIGVDSYFLQGPHEEPESGHMVTPTSQQGISHEKSNNNDWYEVQMSHFWSHAASSGYTL